MPGVRGLAVSLLLAAATVAAQEPAQVVLVPVYTDHPLPGVNGSSWSTDLWIWYDRPPLGFDPLMHWTDAVGLGPETLRIYEENQRRIRVVVSEGLLPTIEARRAALVEELAGAL